MAGKDAVYRVKEDENLGEMRRRRKIHRNKMSRLLLLLFIYSGIIIIIRIIYFVCRYGQIGHKCDLNLEDERGVHPPVPENSRDIIRAAAD